MIVMSPRDPFGGYSLAKHGKSSKGSVKRSASPSLTQQYEVLTLKKNPDFLTKIDSSSLPFSVEVSLGDSIEMVAVDPSAAGDCSPAVRQGGPVLVWSGFLTLLRFLYLSLSLSLSRSFAGRLIWISLWVSFFLSLFL